MKKLILFILMSVFVLSVGYAFEPIKTDLKIKKEFRLVRDFSYQLQGIDKGITETIFNVIPQYYRKTAVLKCDLGYSMSY